MENRKIFPAMETQVSLKPMPVKVEKCPLCKHANSRLFDNRAFRDYQISNHLCMNCGLVFQSQKFTELELDAFYSDHYRQVYQGTADPTSKDLFVQHQRANHLVDFLAAETQTIESFLDIGSSAGIFLTRVRDHFNCKVAGVEPGDKYRQYARENDLDVYASLDEMEKIGNGTVFDVVCMSHVLEHISDPVEYLSKLKEKFLVRDGKLLVEVPNLYCHDSFEIAHNVAFSSHTLRQTIQQAGFKIVRIKKHGNPRSEILPLYITVLAARSDAMKHKIAPDRFVTLKRKYGMIKRKILQKTYPKQAWLPLPDKTEN